MVAGAASSGFEWLYALRVIAAAGVLWHYRTTYRKFDWHIAWPGGGVGGRGFPDLDCAGAAERLAAQQHSCATRCCISLAPLGVDCGANIGGVVTVPIAEELAFRGFLLRRLISPQFESVSCRTLAWAPVLISSLGFGLLHGERWLPGTIAGVVFAFAMTRRGKISDAITAHAVTNALLAVYVLSTGNWQLW